MKCKYLFLSVFIALMAVFSAKAQVCDYFEDFEGDPKGERLQANVNWLTVESVDENKFLVFNHTSQSGNGTRNSWYKLNCDVEFTKKLVVEYDYYVVGGINTNSQEQSVRFLGNGQIVQSGTDHRGEEMRQIFSMSHIASNLDGVGKLYFNAGDGSPKTYAHNYGNDAHDFVSAVPDVNKGFVSFETQVWYTIKAEVYSGDRIDFTVTNQSSGTTEILSIQLPETFSATILTALFFNGARSSSGVTWNCRLDNLCIRDASEDAAVEYNLTVVGGTGAIGSGTHAVGEFVTIDAGEPPAGQRFLNWTADKEDVAFGNAASAITIFAMFTAENVTVTANFEVIPPSHLVTVVSEGEGATESGEYEQGTTVTIAAGTTPAGKRFVNWTSEPAVEFADAESPTTSFTMPEAPVTVTANFENLPSFMVTVTSEGSGATESGEHVTGATVSIFAGTPPEGFRFEKWTSEPEVAFAPSAYMANASFVMPESAIEVTAYFIEDEPEEVKFCGYFEDFEGDLIGQIVNANAAFLRVNELEEGSGKSLQFHHNGAGAGGVRNTWYQLNDAIEFDKNGKLTIEYDYYAVGGASVGANINRRGHEQSIWFLGNGTISGDHGWNMSQLFVQSHVDAEFDGAGKLYFAAGVPYTYVRPSDITHISNPGSPEIAETEQNYYDGGEPMYFRSNFGVGSDNIGMNGRHRHISRAPEERKAYTSFETDVWYTIKAEIYDGDRIDFTVTNKNSLVKEVVSIQLPENFSATDVRAIFFNGARSDGSAGSIEWNARMDNLCIGALHQGLCIDPMPASGVSVRQHPSMKLSWKLPADVTVDAFEVYAGETAKTMTKVGDVLSSTAINGAFSFEYTPAEPLTSGSAHFWRVDAIAGGETITEGTLWNFKPVTLDEYNLVDFGTDYDGVKTSYDAALSGIAMSAANPAIVYPGTNKQATFSHVSAEYQSNNGGYLQVPNTPFWRFENTSEERYFDIALTSESSSVRGIKKFVINGTDATPAGTSRTSPIVVFSNNAVFDVNSIIGYQQVTLGICRQGNTGSVSHRGQAAIVVDAPAGAKSVRVYNAVKLTKTGNTFKFDEEGDIDLTQANQARIAYVGVELAPSASDNTIRSMTIENRPVFINHAAGTAEIKLAFKGEFTVDFTLGNVEATADFVSGSTHNFAEGPLVITVTAGDGSTKEYTITVVTDDVGPGGGSYKVALIMHNSTYVNVTTGNWDSPAPTQGYDKLSHDRFMEAFEGHEVDYFDVQAGNKSKDELLEMYSDYDLIVLHTTIAGTDPHLLAIRNIVGEKAILNTKSFAYSSGRWSWGTPTNASSTVTHVNVNAELQTHPIFNNLTFDGDKLVMYNGDALPASNSLSRVVLDGNNWTSNLDLVNNNHVLATHADGATGINMHEVNLNNAAKYILVSVSTESSAFRYLSNDAILLLRNAINYLGCSSIYFDYASQSTVGGCGGSSNVICDFQFDYREGYILDSDDRTYTNTIVDGKFKEDPWDVDIKVTGSIVHQNDNNILEGCGTPGVLRLNSTSSNSGQDANHSLEVVFNEPMVALLRIPARTQSGSQDAIMKVQGFKYDVETGTIGERLWNEDIMLGQTATDNTTDPPTTNIIIGGNIHTECTKFEKEDIEGPFLIRITRTTGGGVGVLGIYATRPGAAPEVSDDATLKSLTVTQGTLGEVALTPEFDPEVLEYAVIVPARAGQDNVTITAVRNHNKAVVTGDGGPKALALGDNIFPIEVQAENLITKLTYNLKVTMMELQNVVITFNANGSAMAAGDETKTVMQFEPIGALPTPNVWARHEFRGWNTAQDGSGEVITATSVCYFGSSTAITLYAMWMEEVTITFDPQGAEFQNPDEATRIRLKDQQIGKLPMLVEREGFRFEGWNRNADGQGDFITEDLLCDFGAGVFDVTLYAIIQTPTWTVSFNLNGAPGSNQLPSRNIKHGNPVGALPQVFDDWWPGKEFVDWFDNAEGTGTAWTAETPVTASVTLYAKWRDKAGPATGVSEFAWDNLKLYPNPASNVVSISGLEGGELISIFDAAGRLWLNTKAANAIEDIAVNDLPKGTYLVKITKGNAEKTIKLLVD